ncbi:MAG TPA: ATP-binding cassette domain-containing protein, partial [Roseateles sp.]|nr:ATP-binding cassette domain-containing protein [Roseateles sp.]HWT55332.1 ATP-binding cassette domain-containing protein [Rhodocyclaceae bacterium]
MEALSSPLQVDGLRKSFGETEVVAGVSFELRRGECFGLLGPNGAGKTTTLRCCLGLTGAGSLRAGGYKRMTRWGREFITCDSGSSGEL